MQDGRFCEQSDCLVSGDDNVTVECPLCEELLFCSTECRDEKRGFVEHLSGGLCPAKTTYTPRSVLSRMQEALRDNVDAKYILEKKQQACPLEAGGILVLDLLDLDNACAILNSTTCSGALVIAQLCVLTSLGTLDPTLQERYHHFVKTQTPEESTLLLLVVRTRAHGSIFLRL